MPKKDLKNLIDGIEQNEEVTSRLEEKVKRLTELVERQKKVIKDQNELLEKQKDKLASSEEIPDDVRELRRIIGEQRAIIKEKEIEIETAKGEKVQAQTELQTLLKRIDPQQLKIEGAIQTIGNLKEELARYKSEIALKNETLKTLANRLKESEAVSKSLQERVEEMETTISKEEVEEMKIKHSEERKQLKSEITNLESNLLDQKLEFEEKISEAKDIKEKYVELGKKLEELNNKNKKSKEKIKSLEANMIELKIFREDNIDKISYLDKLKPLMEEDPLFRSFFITQEVGAISIEDLKAAVGAPIVTVKRDVERLKNIGVLDESDTGKIIPVKFD